MADKKKMSPEDILAACRSSDASSSDEPAPSEDKTTSEPSAAPAKPAADPKDMSVADILAAARTGDSGGGEEAPAPEAPAAPAAPAKKASEMSVAEMLAAARGGGGGGEAKPKPKAAPKPAAKKADKSSPKAAAKPARSGPMDTSSILAAARGDKPGPMSKSEAAAKAKDDPKAKGKVKPTLPPMPEKPAYAKPAAKSAASSDRRGFIALILGSFLAVGFTTLSLTNLLWVLGLARFMFPNILIEPPSKFKVGFPGDFAAGSVDTKFKAQFGVWVTNVEFNGQQQIVALKTVCTHLGCTPNWLEAEQKFKCPCHGSGFYKDGVNFEGPAPRPLERYAIRLADDGQLEVDKSKTFQEEMGQWNDPSCFVGV